MASHVETRVMGAPAPFANTGRAQRRGRRGDRITSDVGRRPEVTGN
jgi:hypothetical protein